MHGETHGGGRVVPSLMVAENGAIRYACTFFWIPLILPQWATADASHGTGKKRVVPHSYRDGKQASEGVVVGMMSGLADAHGWTSVGCYFLWHLVKGNSLHEGSWCLFHIFCSPQPEIPNFWNTAAFSNVAPVQLYSGILDCSDKGSRYKWNKLGKSDNWFNCDFGNWRGAGPIC